MSQRKISYQENNDAVDFGQVLDVLANAIPARRNWDKEKVREAFLHSSHVVYAYDGNRIVAAARVLSDNAEWTLIGDLAVHPSYQRNGIGKELLKRILNKYKGHEIFTYTYADKIPFFEEYGFRRSKNAFTYSGTNETELEQDLAESGYYLPLGYKYENDYYPVVGDFPVGKKNSRKADSANIHYSDRKDGIDFDRVNELLSLAFGGHERDAAVTKKVFCDSRYCEFAYDGEKIIGCARAVSDGISQGFILNVAVDPEYQGLHLGWNVVSKLAQQMKGQNIFLNTHPGGVGFYNRAGFRRNKTALLYPAHPDMPHEIEIGFVLPKGYKFADEY